MGLGWVAIKSEKEKTPRQELAEFKGAIRDWPSSTRAELAAIWSALLVAPRKVAVTICTDSAAAIQAIRAGMTKGRNSETLKRKNLCLLEHINRLVQIKELKLRLRKVKGHGGIIENEKADKLAKKGALSDRILVPKWP